MTLNPKTEIWPVVQQRLRAYMGACWDVEEFSSAIGVTPGTVGEWLTTDRPTVGEKLIRLWHYLAAVGHDSPEIGQLSDLQRYSGQLLAMSIVTMDEVMEFFGVKTPQTALQILRGQPPMHPLMQFTELQAEYDEALQVKLAALREHGREISVQPAAKSTVPASQLLKEITPEPIKPRSSGATDEFIVQAAMKVGAVLPLCRYLNSDRLTPEQRSRFRELIGSDELFDLTNILGALCGERARNSIK